MADFNVSDWETHVPNIKTPKLDGGVEETTDPLYTEFCKWVNDFPGTIRSDVTEIHRNEANGQVYRTIDWPASDGNRVVRYITNLAGGVQHVAFIGEPVPG